MFYLIGFVVCLWGMASSLKPDDRSTPLNDLAMLGIALIWPLALAVWMRDVYRAVHKNQKP